MDGKQHADLRVAAPVGAVCDVAELRAVSGANGPSGLYSEDCLTYPTMRLLQVATARLQHADCSMQVAAYTSQQERDEH